MVRCIGFSAFVGATVASTTFDDESSLMQVKVTKHSSSGPTSNKFTVAGENDCGRDFKVPDEAMCRAAAAGVGVPTATKFENDNKHGPAGCVLRKLKRKNVVQWNKNDHCGNIDRCPMDKHSRVCLQQAAKSEWCAGKVCETHSFMPENITDVLDVATGNHIPETLRGLWFMDGNPMPDSVLSLQIDFVEEPGDLLVGKLHHSSNNVALHDTEQGRGLFKVLESTQPNYYEFRCKFGNNDTNNIEDCTISVSLLGAPPIPTGTPVFQWTMVPMTVDDPNHIKEDGPNADQQLTMRRGSTMFGTENTYYARRIVDQHGQKLPNNWNHFVQSMKEQGHDTLAYIHNTKRPAPAPDPLKVRIGTILASAMEMVFASIGDANFVPANFASLLGANDEEKQEQSALLQAVKNFSMTEDQHSQPEHTCDRNSHHPQPTIMSRLKQAMEVGSAMAAAEGRENPAMSGLAAVVDRVTKIFISKIWQQAYEDGDKQPINPISNDFILRDSPLPYPVSALLFTWEQIIEIINGFVMLPLFQAPVHGNGNRTYLFSQYAQLNCWETDVFSTGPSVFKYSKVSADMADPTQSRGYFTAAANQHQSVFNVDLPLFLSSGSDQHSMWRQMFERTKFARRFPVPLKVIKKMVTWSPLVNGTVDKGMIARAVFPFTQQMLWGAFPDEAAVAATAPYLKEGSLGIFGDTAHNLIAGVRHEHGEPSMTENLIGYRKAALAWVKTTPVFKSMKNDSMVRDYIDKYPGLVAVHPFNEQLGYNTEEDHFFMNIVDATLFAGYIGTTDLLHKCVRYQHNNSDMENLFKEDPEAFIIELMRYDGAVASFTALYKEDTEEVIEGKKLVFKKGSPYQASLMTANRDPTEFEEPAQFNTKRANIGNSLSWNGRLEDVERRDLVKAPRHCPGHCASLKLGAALCAQFMGSFDELMKKGMLTAEIKCNRFPPIQGLHAQLGDLA